MNQEIEYAEMLEIPVSTVNVVRRRQKSGKTPSLQESLIDKINSRPYEESAERKDEAQEEAGEPQQPLTQDFTTTVVEDAPMPVRWKRRRKLFLRLRRKAQEREEMQSLPVQAAQTDSVADGTADGITDGEVAPLSEKTALAQEGLAEAQPDAYALTPYEPTPSATPYAQPESKRSRAEKLIYRIEFACACVLCLGIFLTNVFVPGSAINTFFRNMTTVSNKDSRTYEDFTLSSIVGDYSTTTVSVSAQGVVSFTAEGCVYPCADGKVSDILLQDGVYVVRVEHSPSFTSVLSGVDYVYYQIGDEVKHNVPIAYSKGTGEVQMTMYDGGELLTCVQIDEENCLTWAEAQK